MTGLALIGIYDGCCVRDPHDIYELAER
jgi:hypothetical protein